MTEPDPVLMNAIATADWALRTLTLLLGRDGMTITPRDGDLPLDGIGVVLGGFDFVIREG